MNWRSSFARINWDLHSALGFWCFLFVTMWGISGAYFSFPQVFNEVGDFILLWLSNLHFGRLGWFAEALWTLLGLVPAVLSFTGVFLCCRRMIYNSQLDRQDQPGIANWTEHSDMQRSCQFPSFASN